MEINEAVEEMQKYKYMRLALESFSEQRAKKGDIIRPNPISPKILEDEGVFFVFNDKFLMNYFYEYDLSRFGMYDKTGEICMLYKRIIFPIRDIEDNIVAFNAHTTDPQFPKYQLSSGSVWNKKKYFYARKWDYEEGFKRNYINICDGTIDKLRINEIDEPTFGLMDSYLSPERISMLQCYENIIFHRDKDKAGDLLYENLKRIPKINIIEIIRPNNTGKDIDDFCSLGKEYSIALKKAIDRAVKYKMSMEVKI